MAPKFLPATLLMLAGITATIGCDGDGNADGDAVARAFVQGAGYTTFDATRGGCLDNPNGVDCNNYSSKDAVYMSGGPSASGLSDGDYFFVVLTPGHQRDGFLDGAEGNLSDTVAGGTTGDQGSGDDVEDRTFTVSNHQILDYQGTHEAGRSPLDKPILQLMPFDDTDNAGGVYILGICRADALSPAECKYDAFRIQGGVVPPEELGTVHGGKYYDANANGMREEGEPGLPNWQIDYNNGEVHRVQTAADGLFRVDLSADTYTFAEVVPVLSPSWRQTGNRVDQTWSNQGASVTLNWDMSYDVVVVDGGESEDLWFGNVCVGGGGGHTLGFWSNKNGAALTTSADLTMLAGLSLVDAGGEPFDPADTAAFSTWLRAGSATNMAYMLSVQLAAMQMNVAHFVDANAMVYAPGTRTVNVNGFTTVAALTNEANASLIANPVTVDASPERSYQEAIKNALDSANNDRTFVRPTPDSCPAPIFVAPSVSAIEL